MTATIAGMETRPNQLRLRRLAMGLRLRDVENATGIPESSLSRLERGEQPPHPQQLQHLAEFFGISPEQIRSELQRPALEAMNRRAEEGATNAA